jgi:peptidoglycan hydrolase CwlO-like protein
MEDVLEDRITRLEQEFFKLQKQIDDLKDKLREKETLGT